MGPRTYIFLFLALVVIVMLASWIIRWAMDPAKPKRNRAWYW